MANKYVDVSATFNGDGTTKDQATVDGGVGAWNDFANAFQGTPVYGEVVAGDVIYVRTSDGVTDLGITISANLAGTPAGTVAAPVVFLIDSAGDIWDAGVFTVESTSTTDNYEFNPGDQCFVQANSEKGFRLLSNLTNNSGYKSISVLRENHHKNWWIQSGTTTNSTATYVIPSSGSSDVKNVLYENFYFDVRSNNNSTSYSQIIKTSSAGYGFVNFVNLIIDYTNCPSTITLASVFGIGSYSQHINVLGFRMIGGLDSIYFANLSSGASYTVRNAKVSHRENISPVQYADLDSEQYSRVQGFNGNSLDTFEFSRAAVVEWRGAGMHPTLNASLPTGDPWSYKVEPSANVGPGEVGKIADLLQFYKLADATRTISLDILLPTDYGTPNDSEFFFITTYSDETDTLRAESSQGTFGNASSLAAGSSSWQYTTVYTEAEYNPWKIELTTAHQIKQNTAVYITVFMARARETSADSLFVDPAFVIA